MVRLSLVMGLGAVDVGWGPLLEGLTFLRKSWLSLTFWIVAFLNTEGFAGVERGVGGVEFPSNDVFSPVLASLCRTASTAGSACACDSELIASACSVV